METRTEGTQEPEAAPKRLTPDVEERGQQRAQLLRWRFGRRAAQAKCASAAHGRPANPKST
jgi:hypothetical protein